jgi:CheY-like chemotaxis protein
VEDDPKTLELITLSLEHQPYQITAARSGTEALELLRERPVDALIVDLKMEPPNGLDVIEAVAADPVTRDAPILVLTEAELTRDEVARLEDRVVAILGKGGVSMRWRENLVWELQRATRQKRTGAQTHA